MKKEIFVVGGARTPMAEYVGSRTGKGEPGGAFKDISAIDLCVTSAKGAFEKTGFEPGEMDHCVIGNALQTSGDAIYGARHVALKAGIPVHVPALTVNRICGSGLQAVVSGAQLIELDEARAVLAGGMESMSQCPHVLRGLRSGLRLGEGKLEDSLMVALLDPYCGLYMAQTAEKLSGKYGITREEQDKFAVVSQTRAGKAQKEGKFKDEIVAVPLPGPKGKDPVYFSEDDHLKPDTTLDALSKLRPAFGKDGMVTAGNASGIVDGAAAVVIADSETTARKKASPLGRIVSWGIVGVDPDLMGIGPAPAIREALKKANLKLDDIDLFEINEAFAAQFLPVEKELGLDREKVNVNGGAIALGHPLGATGARILLSLLHEMRRRKSRYGIASACIGGGQGIAVLVERA